MHFKVFFRRPKSALSALICFGLGAVLCACGAPAAGKNALPGPLCGPENPCAKGACVASRCRAPEASPAPPDGKRMLLAPSELALLSPHGPAGGGSRLPETLNAGENANTVLLFRFEAPIQARADIASAFLILEPSAYAPPRHTSSRVQVARILEPWSASTATWGRQPRLSLPEDAGFVYGAPPSTVRIDVTALVRAWPKRRPDDHGIALLLDESQAGGLRYTLGITEGNGPRLEVYLR